MGLQKKGNPYPNGNFALMLDFLEELISIVDKEKGLVAIPEADGGYEDLLFEGSEVRELKYPSHAVSATVMVELLAGESPANNLVIRFKEHGDPSLVSGFGLGHNDIFEVNGVLNLKGFRAIGLVENVALRVTKVF